MKQLCIVNYVFGTTYQEYIPLYIIALNESYPQYDLIVYVDGFLTTRVKKMLNLINNRYKNFKIIENPKSVTKLSEEARKFPQIQKSQRWLFYEDIFNSYEAIYVGDIDILLCKEENPIFEQHLLHCETIGAPYSNICRLGKQRRYSIRSIGGNLLRNGILQTSRYYISEKKQIKKFSGLHFVVTNEYFQKVNLVKDYFYNELNLLAKGNSSVYNICSFNNEAMLRDLILKAGFSECPLVTNEKYNSAMDAKQIAYRPHHGIHLGIFRNERIISNEYSLITSDVYLNYFEQFRNLIKLPAFNEIKPYFSSYLGNILDRVYSFYNQE